MGHLFVVGDIHGCARELEVLLGALPLGPEDTIVFVGDYVDRGPASMDVVRTLLELQRNEKARTVCLKGNHEDMLLAYMGYPGHHGEAFMYNGGDATLASYGVSPWLSGSDLANALPADHLGFLCCLEKMYLAPPFLITHAGIDPERSLADQREKDLFWIRERFIEHPHRLPYTVCFGHTARYEVLIDLPYKIGLDTGCVYGNRLSCIQLSCTEPKEARLYQIPTGQRRAETRDLTLDLSARNIKRDF